ncbi:MAG: transposase, partial [Candidatus Omnitrophota bacterium]
MADVIDLIEQGKVKRYFRTRDKYCFEGAISHITQHASGTEPLFLEDSDYLYMLHLLKETLGKFKCKVLSFALMPNHIHLLLKFLEANMPDLMKILLQRYAEYFNKKYQRRGHVFSGNYRSALCFDDRYLLAASLYVHMNPVKKGLVQNPADYRWSSCALFVNETEKETFVDYKFVLGALDDDILRAKAKYKDLLGKIDIDKINNAFEQPCA